MTAYRGRACTLLMGLWLAAGAGCQQPTGRLVAKEPPFFPDVPLPIGFGIVEKHSEDRMTGKRRVYVRHTYEGDGDSYQVRDFYRERMPQYKWRVVEAGQVGNVHRLRFKKGDEACTVTITPGSWGKTRFEIMIVQEEIGNYPAEKKSS